MTHGHFLAQDGAVLRFAMVCENSTVGAGAVVEPGAIVSYGVVVGPRHRVPPHTYLSLCKQSQQVVRAWGQTHGAVQLTSVHVCPIFIAACTWHQALALVFNSVENACTHVLKAGSCRVATTHQHSVARKLCVCVTLYAAGW